jgi:hypothetical protein
MHGQTADTFKYIHIMAARRPIFGTKVQPRAASPFAVAGWVGGGFAALVLIVVLVTSWPSKGGLEQALAGFTVVVDTQGGSAADRYRTYLVDTNGGRPRRVSFWHDIPLPLADARSRRVIPFVNEISVGYVRRQVIQFQVFRD